MLEYLQWLRDKVLEKEVTLLKGAERFQVIGSKLLWQPLDTKSNDHTTSKSLKADI